MIETDARILWAVSLWFIVFQEGMWVVGVEWKKSTSTEKALFGNNLESHKKTDPNNSSNLPFSTIHIFENQCLLSMTGVLIVHNLSTEPNLMFWTIPLNRLVTTWVMVDDFHNRHLCFLGNSTPKSFTVIRNDQTEQPCSQSDLWPRLHIKNYLIHIQHTGFVLTGAQWDNVIWPLAWIKNK